MKVNYFSFCTSFILDNNIKEDTSNILLVFQNDNLVILNSLSWFSFSNYHFLILPFGFQLALHKHYCGSPGLSFLVALDTGSSLFWLPCDCKQCYNTKSAQVCYYFSFSPDSSQFQFMHDSSCTSLVHFIFCS